MVPIVVGGDTKVVGNAVVVGGNVGGLCVVVKIVNIVAVDVVGVVVAVSAIALSPVNTIRSCSSASLSIFSFILPIISFPFCIRVSDSVSGWST